MYIVRRKMSMGTRVRFADGKYLFDGDYLLQDIKTGVIIEYSLSKGSEKITKEEIVNVHCDNFGSQLLPSNIPVMVNIGSGLVSYSDNNILIWYSGMMYDGSVKGSITSDDLQVGYDLFAMIHVKDNDLYYVDYLGASVRINLNGGIKMSKSQFLRTVMM